MHFVAHDGGTADAAIKPVKVALRARCVGHELSTQPWVLADQVSSYS
jgi:hypothetical protein